MPRNYYIGWSVSELEAVQRAIQGALTTGQATEISIAGVRTVYDPKNATNLESQLDRVEYSLYLKDQELDTADQTGAANPYATRNRHTQVDFR